MAKFQAIFVLTICSVAGRIVAHDWWMYGHIYQIYPRSFQDSNGDGIGDLNGITSRLDHLQYIGITGAWLTSILKSPNKDMGYDISDFRAIQPEYGTMDDFENLVACANELNIHVIMDFVPNHSSDQHEWFKASSDPTHPNHEKYKDYYIWNKGRVAEDGTRYPPSNWLSLFRGSAWTWVEARQEYYLHQFYAEQPDLNLRNRVVVEELNEVIRFWLRKGVAGIRIDSVPFLYETEENSEGYYNDEPLSGTCQEDPLQYCYLTHTQTRELNETIELIYEWREVLREPEFSALTRILLPESYSPLNFAMRLYGVVENGEITTHGCQIPFNFELMDGTWMDTHTYGFKEYILKWLNKMPILEGIQANWVLGNHDNDRIATRYKPSRTDIFNILLNTLPGIAVTYYGEEIGMTNVAVPSDDTREPVRTPMQWDTSKNAGFSTANSTWLPLPSNYRITNVEVQMYQERSFLRNFRLLNLLRQNPTLKYGSLQVVPIDNDIMAYKREIDGDANADVIVVVLNLVDSVKSVNLNDHFENLPENMQVDIASIHSDHPSPGTWINTDKLTVSGNVGLVLVGNRYECSDQSE